jgi:hypothetical protein
MARAKRWEAGTRNAGLAIEYLRTRKVVRLLGWVRDEVIDPVEIPVDEFCARLGMDPRCLGAPLLFLLFAGSEPRPRGGLQDLAGTFECPDKAWAAFRELRHSHASLPGWAQLATIDGTGRVRQLAWYGLGPDGDGDEQGGCAPAKESGRPLRRILPTSDATSQRRYLRAVTPS